MVGTVDGLWRYPVKSMVSKELEEAFVGFPYLTGREQEQMLRYRPRFRHPEKAARPPNLAAAERIAPGINPVNADPADMGVDVQTPSGATLPVEDPELMGMLNEGVGVGDDHVLTLVRSERALTDC